MQSNLPSNPTASAQQLTVSGIDLRAAAETIMADIDRPLATSRILPAPILTALMEASSHPTALSSTDHALQSVKMLMGQYRNGQFQDTDVFATALTALFAEHPAKYVQEVAIELPREMKWPPSIAEVAEALKAKSTKRAAINYRTKVMLAHIKAQQAESEKKPASAELRAEIIKAIQAKRMENA